MYIKIITSSMKVVITIIILVIEVRLVTILNW